MFIENDEGGKSAEELEVGWWIESEGNDESAGDAEIEKSAKEVEVDATIEDEIYSNWDGKVDIDD